MTTDTTKNNNINATKGSERTRPASNGMKHTIDATNKKLGRVASQAAVLLMGKDTSFKKNEVREVTVEITNAAKLSIDEKKLDDKKYLRYSGYPGGLKTLSMKQTIDQKGKGYAEILKQAVNGMLQKNTLQKQKLKNLIIKA